MIESMFGNLDMDIDKIITLQKKYFLCGDECTDFFIITFFCIGIGVEKLKFKNAW